MMLTAAPLAAQAPQPLNHDLLRVSATGTVDQIRDLLERGADPNSEDKVGVTPLINVAARGSNKSLRLLIEAGARVEEDGRNGCTPLTWAAKNGWEKTIELLLDRGADINHRDNGQMTPLMRAAWNGQFVAAEFLIRRGADVTAVDSNGNTALTYALASRSPRIEGALRRMGVPSKVGSQAEAIAKVKGEPFVSCARAVAGRS
ncbi:MAG: ankyrin repeat domain-containing protein [Alphaproteobacteria bacterium]